VNEAVWRSHEVALKQSAAYLEGRSITQEGEMRALIFGSILVAVVALGAYSLISSSLAAARDDRPATFSERFAPVLKHG
jgi:hypothetical protein